MIMQKQSTPMHLNENRVYRHQLNGSEDQEEEEKTEIMRHQFQQSRFLEEPSLLRHGSYCSTCSSHSSLENEEEDVSVSWPWIDHIKENGDLFFIESVEIQEDKSFSSIFHQAKNAVITNSSMPRNIQSKIKTALKKSRSFNKKDVMKAMSDKRSLMDTKENNIGNKRNSENINSRYSRNSIYMNKRKTGFLCDNVVIKLEKPCNENFINLENIFGVISGLDLDHMPESNGNDILHNGNDKDKSSNDIIVQGLLPNGPAAMCADIQIGDFLVAINGIQVDSINIDAVLTEAKDCTQFFITIERLNPDYSELNEEKLSTIITNNAPNKDHPSSFAAYCHLCVVANLSFNGTENDPGSDITFWYPDSEHVKTLKAVRGIFLTLSDVLVDITKTQIKCTELFVDNILINICYFKYAENVLIFGLPNYRCSLTKLQSYLDDLLVFLKISFQTIENAFDAVNIDETKHLVLLFMEIVLKYDNPLQSLGCTPKLSLSNQHYVDISSVLNDSEAADYGECIDDFFPHRRLYCTLGTCIFYKGELVCSHLPDDYLKDILVFCKYYWLFLLTLNEKLKQLVIWKEIFLSSNEECGEADDDFAKPSDLRWFILIVGQGNSLLCTLLEAGGASSIPEGNPGPHPYYVDTASSILSYLIENFQFEKLCQAKLDGALSPAIVKPIEALNPRMSRSPRALMLTQRKCVGNYNQYLNESTLLHETSPLERHNSIGSSNSGSNHEFMRTNTLSASINSIPSVNITTDISLSMALSTKLTAGFYNTLLYFLTFQKTRGTFICPNASITDGSDNLTQNIIKCFQYACEQIHDMFARKQHDEVRDLEHGLLFHAEQTHGAELKRNAPNMTYWVVGRLIQYGVKEEEEIYVCFQDGVPQNVIEIAFKLRYGCH